MPSSPSSSAPNRPTGKGPRPGSARPPATARRCESWWTPAAISRAGCGPGRLERARRLAARVVARLRPRRREHRATRRVRRSRTRSASRGLARLGEPSHLDPPSSPIGGGDERPVRRRSPGRVQLRAVSCATCPAPRRPDPQDQLFDPLRRAGPSATGIDKAAPRPRWASSWSSTASPSRPGPTAWSRSTIRSLLFEPPPSQTSPTSTSASNRPRLRPLPARRQAGALLIAPGRRGPDHVTAMPNWWSRPDRAVVGGPGGGASAAVPVGIVVVAAC